jgi:hypothetical protein
MSYLDNYILAENRPIPLFDTTSSLTSDRGAAIPPEPFEYGARFPLDYNKGPHARKDAVDTAVEHARSTLPKGAKFNVRTKRIPKNAQESSRWGVAWCTCPPPDSMGTPRSDDLEQNMLSDSEFGYCLVFKGVA